MDGGNPMQSQGQGPVYSIPGGPTEAPPSGPGDNGGGMDASSGMQQMQAGQGFYGAVYQPQSGQAPAFTSMSVAMMPTGAGGGQMLQNTPQGPMLMSSSMPQFATLVRTTHAHGVCAIE